MTRRDRQAGVVLVNVLVMLGLTAAVVAVMVGVADVSIARSQRFSEAAQALALVRAGEASAIVALRRDMVEAPDIDHVAEPWGRVAQTVVAVAGGSFELTLADAQGRFNLNGLAATGLQGARTLQGIVAALELPPATAGRIAASLDRDGLLRDLGDLGRRAGVAPEELAALARFVTALPAAAEVNINAAPTELIAILLQNPVQARVLGSIRERTGMITPEDVAAARAILPPGVGFTSDFYETRVAARVGDTAQAMVSLLQRRIGRDGEPEVAVIRRRNATAAVSPPPP